MIKNTKHINYSCLTFTGNLWLQILGKYAFPLDILPSLEGKAFTFPLQEVTENYFSSRKQTYNILLLSRALLLLLAPEHMITLHF